MNQW